jgi:hypothetical protein
MRNNQKPFVIRPDQKILTNENGSILLIAMMLLFILSLLGTFALNTTEFEIKIAANQQNWEKDFNISEGSAKLEATKVGYARTGVNEWYEISDPDTFNQYLVPPDANFDPGSDMDPTKSIPATFDDAAADDYTLWPRENMIQDPADNLYDYAYLVTYLFPSLPPKGYDSSTFSGYKFRINGERKVIIELGGIKVGVKSGI